MISYIWNLKTKKLIDKENRLPVARDRWWRDGTLYMEGMICHLEWEAEKVNLSRKNNEAYLQSSREESWREGADGIPVPPWAWYIPVFRFHDTLWIINKFFFCLNYLELISTVGSQRVQINLLLSLNSISSSSFSLPVHFLLLFSICSLFWLPSNPSSTLLPDYSF